MFKLIFESIVQGRRLNGRGGGGGGAGAFKGFIAVTMVLSWMDVASWPVKLWSYDFLDVSNRNTYSRRRSCGVLPNGGRRRKVRYTRNKVIKTKVIMKTQSTMYSCCLSTTRSTPSGTQEDSVEDQAFRNEFWAHQCLQSVWGWWVQTPPLLWALKRDVASRVLKKLEPFSDRNRGDSRLPVTAGIRKAL